MPAETTGVLNEQAAVEAFAERVLGDYAGANAFFMAGIGDRLGLFKELAANGAATSDELATWTRLQERYVREWLGGMAAAGYLDYDPATSRYALPADPFLCWPRRRGRSSSGPRSSTSRPTSAEPTAGSLTPFATVAVYRRAVMRR